MTKGPTVYDVAERAGVSIATVSFTFRRPSKVKESTRELVHAAARELGYIPSGSARGLAGGRTGALGLISLDYRPVPPLEFASNHDPGSTDPNADFRLFPLFVDEVQRGVEQECWRRGYAVMIAGAKPSNAEAVLTDIAGRVDGLALFFSGMADDVDLRHIAERLPVVLMSQPGDDTLSRVCVDNVGGMRALIQHLVQVHGLRDLRFVGPTFDSDRKERFDAFRATLRAAKLPVPRDPMAAAGNYREAIADLTHRQAIPDAFVCVTDEVALELMDTLREAKIDVPGQVVVTGFDGIVAGRLISPQLTTVRQPMEAMGATVVRLLIDRIDQPDASTASETLPVQLLLRESCGCPPQQPHPA
ncbi:LacI family DNA-binding transcriptional regulator [Terrabacter sp. GCM10028922]|uniref:LacI family DNA-binding transcriptional regulator n=1 Tax=Terrabacter sp. GCM10028922 TaxID=3273428 RepID=UPI00361207A1